MNLEAIFESIELTKEIYFSTYKPSLETYNRFELIGFCAGSTTLISHFTSSKAAVVVSGEVDTAAMRFLSPREIIVYIPRGHFDIHRLRSFVRTHSRKFTNLDLAYLCISLVNGGVLHEALHGALTNKEELESEVINKYTSKALQQTAWIFEDFFINTVGFSYNEVSANVRKFLKCSVSVLFNSSRIERDVKKGKVLDTVANNILMLKNPEIVTDVLKAINYIEGFTDLVDLLFEFISEAERIALEFSPDKIGADYDFSLKHELMIQIIDFLKKYDEENPSESMSNTNVENQEGKSELNPKSYVSYEDKALSKGITGAKTIEVLDSIFEYIPKVVVRDISKCPQSGVSYDRYFPTLDSSMTIGTDFLRMRNYVPTSGPGMKRGTRIGKTSLPRIATDGKIFVRRVVPQRINTELPEVVIIGDASGSMRYNLYEKELNTMYTMTQELMKAGVPVTVCVQTSAYAANVPGLFIIAQSQSGHGIPNLEEKFKMAYGIKMSQNYDGFILKESFNLFRTQNKRRVIIWISDGKPWGNNYKGKEANLHTKETVAYLKRKGVGFISISLKKECVDFNDKLFGSDNIDASEGLSAKKMEIQAILKSKAIRL